MSTDPSLDNLNPDVALDDNTISDSSDLDIDSQLGNVDLPTDEEPNPSDDFPVEDQPDDSVPPNGDGSLAPPQVPPQAPPQVPPASNAPNVQALIDSYLESRRQQAANANALAAARAEEARKREILHQQQLRQQQPPPAPQPPAPALPPSEQDPVRYQYYLQLCRFMDPRQALELVNQQDQYYEARFQKQFTQAMQQFQPFFQRQAEEAYATDLGRLAAAHAQNFHAAASAFDVGITPEESQAIVSTFLKAYIDSGHHDLADIHNWFSTNSTRILASAVQEKRKLNEELARKNAKSQYQAGKNASTTVTSSTKAAQTLVSTGQEALMKKDGAITGGAPSGTAPSAANGVIQSLMAQTGLNAFSAS